jgi:hypothetical protein
MKFFFANEFSFADTLFLGVAGHGFAQGDILAPIVITMVGLAIHLTVGRKYNAPSA